MERNAQVPQTGAIGPFQETEIEKVALEAAETIGISVEGNTKKRLLGIARDGLAGKVGVGMVADTKTGDSPQDVAFLALFLKNLKESPKWNETEFQRGYRVQHAGTDAQTTQRDSAHLATPKGR